MGIVSCLGPIAFFSFLFGMPIWFIATGFVIGTKARRATKGLISQPVIGNLDLGTMQNSGSTLSEESLLQMSDN